MLYSEIIADYCKDHKKHQATLSKIHTGLVHNTWYIQEALLRIQYNLTACSNCPVRVASGSPRDYRMNILNEEHLMQYLSGRFYNQASVTYTQQFTYC